MGLTRSRAKATADPSTTLRFAQDDNSRVMQFFGAGSISRCFRSTPIPKCYSGEKSSSLRRELDETASLVGLRALPGWLNPEAERGSFETGPERQKWRHFGFVFEPFLAKKGPKTHEKGRKTASSGYLSVNYVF
jgi:hypothetical protein